MNSAVLKYNKIINKHRRSKGSITTIQDDVVAMMTHVKLKLIKLEDERKLKRDAKQKKPPLIKQYKTKADTTGIEYKVGDTKKWNG